jgi:uncharacterized Ntn-hydrolase superfamily protein
MIELTFHTFSIVARCPRTGSFGVSVSTARPAVGAAVPWVSARGAVATQAKTNTELGRRALALLDQGVSGSIALAALLDGDPERDHRQVHGVDADGVFAHTGQACVTWCGDQTAADVSIAGNMLSGPHVLDAMAVAFAASSALELPERLVRALEAAQVAGGDKRGKQSAALLVWSPDPRPHHNLRVDDHADPVAELRRLHDLAVAYTDTLRSSTAPTASGATDDSRSEGTHSKGDDPERFLLPSRPRGQHE